MLHYFAVISIYQWHYLRTIVYPSLSRCTCNRKHYIFKYHQKKPQNHNVIFLMISNKENIRLKCNNSETLLNSFKQRNFELHYTVQHMKSCVFKTHISSRDCYAHWPSYVFFRIFKYLPLVNNIFQCCLFTICLSLSWLKIPRNSGTNKIPSPKINQNRFSIVYKGSPYWYSYCFV